MRINGLHWYENRRTGAIWCQNSLPVTGLLSGEAYDVIYGGLDSQQRSQGRLVSWHDVTGILQPRQH